MEKKNPSFHGRRNFMLYASCSNDFLKTKKPSAKCGRLFVFRVIIILCFREAQRLPYKGFLCFTNGREDCKIILFFFFNGAHRTNDQRTIYQFVRRGGVPPPASNDCAGGNGQKNYCPLFSGGATPPLQGIFMFSQWTGNNKLRLV